MFIKVIALQLAWIACIPVYLAAKQQVLFANRFPKNLAWLIFTCCSAVSILLLNSLYHPLAAFIFTLLAITLTWITLALWAPHYPKPKTIICTIAISFLLISFMGGAHVG